MNDPTLLSVAEVADRLRVHEATVRRWIADGSLPALKLGRTYRVDARALDALHENTSAS